MMPKGPDARVRGNVSCLGSSADELSAVRLSGGVSCSHLASAEKVLALVKGRLSNSGRSLWASAI